MHAVKPQLLIPIQIICLTSVPSCGKPKMTMTLKFAFQGQVIQLLRKIQEFQTEWP